MTNATSQQNVSSDRFAVLKARDSFGLRQANPIKAPERGNEFETQNSKKEVPVELEGGGKVLARVSTDAKGGVDATPKNVKAVDEAMNTQGLRGRMAKFNKNQDPNRVIAATRNMTPSLQGGVTPTLGEGATVMMTDVAGAIQMKGKKAKVISRGRNNFSNTQLGRVSLELDGNGAENMDNSNLLGTSLTTNALPNAANARFVLDEATSNVQLAVGMKAPNTVITAAHDQGHHAEESGESYVAYSSQAPQVGSIAAIQHESRQALNEAHHPLSAALVAHLHNEAVENFSGRAQPVNNKKHKLEQLAA
jgi:hypothetical protein